VCCARRRRQQIVRLERNDCILCRPAEQAGEQQDGTTGCETLRQLGEKNLERNAVVGQGRKKMTRSYNMK